MHVVVFVPPSRNFWINFMTQVHVYTAAGSTHMDHIEIGCSENILKTYTMYHPNIFSRSGRNVVLTWVAAACLIRYIFADFADTWSFTLNCTQAEDEGWEYCKTHFLEDEAVFLFSRAISSDNSTHSNSRLKYRAVGLRHHLAPAPAGPRYPILHSPLFLSNDRH